jgi:hypothetical protein
VEFAGDALYAPARVEVLRDRALAPVRLSLLEPTSHVISLDSETLPIRVYAQSSAGGDAITIELFDELGRAIAAGLTDTTGVLRTEVATSALGEPGSGRLAARSQADERRAAATLEQTVIRARATQLDLIVEHEAGGEVSFRGTLQSAQLGVGGAAVGLFADDQHLATVLTDSLGGYAYEARNPTAGSTREAKLQARYDSSAPWLLSSRSEVVLLTGNAASWASLGALIVPAAVALGLWLRRRRTQRRRQAAGAEQAPSGIALARRSLRTFTPQASLRGVVRDGSNGQPIARARIALQCEPARVSRSDEQGRFELDDLPAGEATLSFEADGFVPLQARVRLPHHGEWEGIDAKLESVRKAVMRVCRPATVSVAPSPDLIDVLTIREASAHARLAGRSAAWDALAPAVEAAAYRAPTPSVVELRLIEDLSDRARAQHGAADDALER